MSEVKPKTYTVFIAGEEIRIRESEHDLNLEHPVFPAGKRVRATHKLEQIDKGAMGRVLRVVPMSHDDYLCAEVEFDALLGIPFLISIELLEPIPAKEKELSDSEKAFETYWMGLSRGDPDRLPEHEDSAARAFKAGWRAALAWNSSLGNVPIQEAPAPPDDKEENMKPGDKVEIITDVYPSRASRTSEVGELLDRRILGRLREDGSVYLHCAPGSFGMWAVRFPDGYVDDFNESQLKIAEEPE